MSNKRVVRSDREAWMHVEKINGDRWRCNFCREEKSGHVQRLQAHLGRVPGLGIAGCKGNVPPGLVTRMRNAANLEKENKKRKQASGNRSNGSNPTTAGPPPSSGASSSSAQCVNTLGFGGAMCNWQANLVNETGPRVNSPQREPSLSLSEYSFPQEPWDPDALLGEPGPSSYALEMDGELITDALREAGANSNLACEQTHTNLSSNTGGANADVQAPEEEEREYGIGRNTLGAGSCQPQTSTLSTQQEFAPDTTQPINNQGVCRAPVTNLDEIEGMLKEAVREHFRTTLASSADQLQCHEFTSNSQNQLNTGLEPSAPPVGSLMQSCGNCNLFDPQQQESADFASLAERFKQLSQTQVDARRKLLQNMLYLVRKAKALTSTDADLKTQLEETESITVKKRKEVVDNWLHRVDQRKEEVIYEINDAFQHLNSARDISIRLRDALGGSRQYLSFNESSHLIQGILSSFTSCLEILERKNNRIVELVTEVDELIEEGKSLLDLTVDVVLQRKLINCRSQLQHFVEQHFKLVMEMT